MVKKIKKPRRSKKKVFKIPNSLTSQNKGARFGRIIAHFFGSLLFVISGYLTDILIGLCKLIYQFFEWVVFKLKSRRKSCKENLKNNVSLGPLDIQKDSKFKPEAEKSNVTFKDLYGLENAEKEIRLRVIEPLNHPNLAEQYNLVVSGGILLFGPPGNGKTEFAKAVANEVDAAFFLLDTHNILGSAGASEKRMSEFFQEVNKYEKAIVFIDEAESAAPSRGKSSSSVRTGMTTQFLKEIGGFRSKNDNGFMIFISATNCINLMDKAAQSRHGIKIEIPLIDDSGRLFIINRELAKNPNCLSGEDLEKIVELTQGYSGRDIVQLTYVAVSRAFERSIDSKYILDNGIVLPVSLQDFEKAFEVIKYD